MLRTVPGQSYRESKEKPKNAVYNVLPPEVPYGAGHCSLVLCLQHLHPLYRLKRRLHMTR